MRQLAVRAKEQTALENDFRRLYLNQHTAQRDRWINMDQWNSLAGQLPDEDHYLCWAALDLSTKTDVTAFVKVFLVGDMYYIVPRMWIPEETAAAREKKDRVPYLQWARDGFVELTEGNRIDQQAIIAAILDDYYRYSIQKIAVDPWNAEAIIQALLENQAPVEECRQNFGNFNEPCQDLTSLIADQKVRHDDNPCMNWMMSNVEVKHNAEGQIRPVKSSDVNRIDGVVALVMALGRAIHGADAIPDYYESNDVTVI